MIDIYSNAWNALTLVGVAKRLLSGDSGDDERLASIYKQLDDAYFGILELTEVDNESTSESGKSDS